VSRIAQATVLFLIGGAILRATFTDLFLRYVKAELRPLLLVAGVVLIVAAGATVWYEWRRSRRDRHDGCGRTHSEPRISWLLLLPVFALILVAPPALGSYSAMRTGTGLQPPWGLAALPASGPLQLSVVDYAGRAVYDHGRSLGDRPITITGFLALDESGEPYLTRMVLNCCAADARPVKVGLVGRVPPILQPDTWYEITGAYTDQRAADPINNGVIPYITVIQARPVPAPDDQYDSRP
jgi:putative membrane protein